MVVNAYTIIYLWIVLIAFGSAIFFTASKEDKKEKEDCALERHLREQVDSILSKEAKP